MTLYVQPLPITDYAPALGGQPILYTGREPELSGLRRLIQPPLIVHVEDEPLMRRFVAMILAVYGYRVRGFTDGESALAFCEVQPPRLLVTDVAHPGLDGISLCRAVKQIASLDETEVMILSACNPRHTELEMRKLGIGWVSKPFRFQELVEAVKHRIGDGAPRPPNAPPLRFSFNGIDWNAEEIYPPYLNRMASSHA
jgi:two-component system, chemotaxis family, chemotaxis protein CheY